MPALFWPITYICNSIVGQSTPLQRFMQIFAGVPMGGGVKRHWGCRQRRFRWLRLRRLRRYDNSASNVIRQYSIPCQPVLSDCKMNDLE